MNGHDIITLGGSAGALEAMRRVLADLPSDLPASLFLAIHQSPYAESLLPEVLSRAGALPAKHPADREPIQRATIYVAPPDHHLLIVGGALRVVQGPKEHNTRPAVDPLFRSAALSYGPRVVGVLLSGLLDDGSSGLAAIHSRGGVPLVQAPADAMYPDMPANGIKQVPEARPLAAAQIGAELARLATAPAPPATQKAPDEMEWEVAMAAWDLNALSGGDRPGSPTPFSCPDCGGDLWEYNSAGLPRFRCRVGHGYSPLSLLAAQSGSIDDTLNEAFRALKEKEHMHRRMAKFAERHRNSKGNGYHKAQADKTADAAAGILRLLLDLKSLNGGETSK